MGRWLAALLLLGSGLASAQVAVPPLHARVTDLSGTLTAQQSAALETRLTAFEQEKGSQIAVLIVPTTQPEEIEQYGIRVAGQWKLGRKGIDDGALLLVATQDRAMRIEVGYGLEGALPDAIAKRIIAETITPLFKQGDIYGGIDAGVGQMIQVVKGEPLPPPPAQQNRGHNRGNSSLNLLLIPFFILYAIGQVLRRAFGSLLAALLVGGGTGFAAALILGSSLLGAGAGVIAAIVALLLFSGAASGLPIFMGNSGGWGSGGGGGGFSGGGGGFGGGGASGRW